MGNTPGTRFLLAMCGGAALLLATQVLAFESLRFKHLSVEDGLSQDTVQAIAQDDQGFVWLATQHGLNRFDGFSFRSYYAAQDAPFQIPGDWVWTLFLDVDGNLWIGTEGGGLAVKASGLDTFRSVPHQPGQTDTLSGYGVRAIGQDNQGWLWIGTDGGGITRLDPTTGDFENFREASSDLHGLTDDQVKALHIDGNGVVWAGTESQGLFRYDPTADRFEPVQLGTPNLPAIRSLTSHGTTLWVGTKESGLFNVHVETGMQRHFMADGSPGALSSNAVRSLMVDRDGMLWVGHDSNGLDRMMGDGRFVATRWQSGNPQSLADNHVSSLYQDSGELVWIGTLRGTSRWNPHAAVFTNVSRATAEMPLSENWISSFAERRAGGFWVGTAGGGINRVRFAPASVETLRAQNNPNSLSDDRVFALSEHNDVLWVGTRAHGLSRLHNGTWKHFRHNPDDPASLSFDGVTSILTHSDGTLWVGTYLGGLNRYNPSTGGFTHFRHQAADPTSLCWDRVLSLTEDTQGMIWIGTHGGGLCRLDPATESFQTFRHDARDTTSLSSDYAWLTAEDASGNLWIGTSDAGLNVWLAEDRNAGIVRFLRINTPEGLASPVIYGLVHDHEGNVWASGNRGIARLRFDPTANEVEVRRLHKSDGLQGSEFNYAAALVASDGRLLFGGTEGLTTFYPGDLTNEQFNPAIRLIGAYGAGGESFGWTSAEPLALTHTDPVVTFEYAAMDFAAPEAIVYERCLVGFDDGWINDANRNRATYTNLAPGTYTLKVRAANADGLRSLNELKVEFTVLPAPWRTGWAYLGYAVAALLLALLAVRSWQNRIAVARHIEQVNENLRSEIMEREAKERALDQQRATSQRYLDVVEVIMVALDPSGRITMINAKGLRVLATTEADAVGRDFCDAFVPIEQRQEVRRRLNSQEPYQYAEWGLRADSGVERLVAWQAIRLQEDEEGMLLSGTDVTQIRDLERQLRDAQKMEALGTLARGVAHDFNNILSAILGYTELSQRDIAKADPAQEHLRHINASVARARDLIQRVLTFGRAASLHPRTVSIAEVIREAIQLVRPVLPREVHLETFLDEDCGTVLADPSQLIQIVLNLSTNAAQSMSQGGGSLEVRLSAYDIDDHAARGLNLRGAGSYARLSVVDSGPGMDTYTQSRIFEPFFTTREQGEGTGLGLAVVHGIVGSLNGAIHVTSRVGAGTRFDVYLPNVRGARTTPISNVTVVSEDTTGAETILFVDDEAAITTIAKRALTRLGYEVLTAADGASALDVFDAHSDEIDLVITDQTMPGVLGEDLARLIKQREPNMLVILISGADRPSGEHVDGFVAKPFTSEQLSRTIRQTLSKRKAA